jgi:Sec-independent protein translocase protein TatA
MGFGMEILVVLVFGLLILGPKQLHTVLAHVARAKIELENATRGLRSQLAAELDAAPGSGKSDCSHVLVGDCELCSTPKSAP